MTKSNKCKQCPAAEAIERFQQLERIYGILQNHTETKIVNVKMIVWKKRLGSIFLTTFLSTRC